MVTKLFDPEEFNAAFKNLKIFSDGQGEDKLTSEGFASMNFDGLIPIEVNNFPAASIVPGMHISLTGSSDGVTFYQVTSVTESDSDLTASPTQLSYIEYLDEEEEVNILETSSSNVYSVFYENWDDKYLGTTGWYISTEGNAIFSNVAVRGEVFAQSGDIGGWIIQNQGTKTHGSIYYDASIDIGESGAGVYVTGINTGYGTHYDTWVPADDEEEDPDHLPSQFYIVYAPGSDPTVAGAKRPRWNSASTTFYVDGHGRFSLGDRLTFDSNSGSLVVGGYASSIDLNNTVNNINSVISASIGGLELELSEISASVDFLYNAGFITNTDLITTGNTTINGNNIITGVIDANLVRITSASSLVQNRGIQLSAIGLEGYDDAGNRTFFLNTNGDGEISGDFSISGQGQIYVGNDKDSGQRINIRSTDLTGYSELGFPVFSLVTGSATSASPLLRNGGFDNLPDGPLGVGTGWSAFWGFEPTSGGHRGSVDSTFYKDGGKSFRVSASMDAISSLTQNYNDLIPGEEYIFSAWVYSNKDLLISSPYVEFVDVWLMSASYGGPPEYFQSGLRVKSLFGAREISANVWTKLSAKFVAPPSIWTQHRFDLRNHVASGGIVWWDSVELKREIDSSEISGFYFNDGELFTENIQITSDGLIMLGLLNPPAEEGVLPDSTNVPDLLLFSGTHPSYRIWSGNINPEKSNFVLDVNGHLETGRITSSATYQTTTSVAYMGITSNGLFSRYSSSQDIKENIISIRNELGESVNRNKIISASPTINYKKVLELSPVEYDKIDEPGLRKFGLIADDVADKIPEIATYDNENNPVYFDLAGLIAASLAIIQEQQQTIDDLKNRMIQLESQIGG